MAALTYTEAEALWSDDHLNANWRSARSGDIGSTYRFLNRAWDDYQKDCEGNILKHLSEVYSNIYSFRSMKPFGFFKDFKKKTPKDYYDAWIAVLRSTPNNGDTVFTTIAKYLRKIMPVYNLVIDTLTLQKSLCVYLYHMAIGMAGEHATLKALHNQKPENAKVAQAPNSYETLDIDAVILTSTGRKIGVSIKCFGALTESSVVKWANKKEKPLYYIGFQNKKDLFDGRLTARNRQGKIVSMREVWNA